MDAPSPVLRRQSRLVFHIVCEAPLNVLLEVDMIVSG